MLAYACVYIHVSMYMIHVYLYLSYIHAHTHAHTKTVGLQAPTRTNMMQMCIDNMPSYLLSLMANICEELRVWAGRAENKEKQFSRSLTLAFENWHVLEHLTSKGIFGSRSFCPATSNTKHFIHVHIHTYVRRNTLHTTLTRSRHHAVVYTHVNLPCLISPFSCTY